jgi:hypothetical protein
MAGTSPAMTVTVSAKEQKAVDLKRAIVSSARDRIGQQAGDHRTKHERLAAIAPSGTPNLCAQEKMYSA